MAVIINGELVEILSLPDQTGHAGQPLVTNGVTADWTAIAGTGDMAKSTYDTNNNGIVDQAAAVNDGAGNSKTAAQIKTHIDSTSNPHNVTAAQVGAPTSPSGTGMVHVTAGVQDGASKLVANVDVDAGAAIAESKLSLNYPTHSNANDPSSDQKNALVGTNGTPYSGNRYVTDSDPRNTNTRTPVAHGSAQHTGTIGTPTQVGLGNVPNVDTTNAANITSGTLPAARLPAMSAGAKGAVPATGAPSGKYLKDDGTFDTPAGAGDMAKATYDIGDNGIVDKAASVDDGAGNAKTALEVKTAIDTTIPGKATLVAGAVNGNLAGLDAGGDLTDSGNAPADFAPAAKGVTDGDSHDHTGGAGAAITEDALSLSNVTTGNVSDTKHGFCPITPNDTDKYLRGDATWAIPPSGGSPPTGTGWRHVTAGVEDAAASTPTKTDVGLPNVQNLDQTNPTNITQDATHRFATDAEKSAWNAKLDPAGSGANLTGIPEGALSFTNITTNDVSTTKHGLTPRAPNDATKFLRGDATWAVPSAGSASWPLVTSKPEITVGDTGYATLDAILAGSPAAGTSILVPSGTHTLNASSDRTLPTGVNLKALSGANITIPSGRTFTVSGNIEAGHYKIFTDNSADLTKGVKFTALSRMTEVLAAWWGAIPCAFNDSTTAAVNTAAINQAINAGANNSNELLASRPSVRLGVGAYYVAGAPVLVGNSHLIGAGKNNALTVDGGAGTQLCPVSGNAGYTLQVTDANGWCIENIMLWGNGGNHVVYITATQEKIGRVTGCYIAPSGNYYGVYCGTGGGRVLVDHNRFVGGNGFYDYADGWVQNNEFMGCGTAIYLQSSQCSGNGIYQCTSGIVTHDNAQVTDNKVSQCTSVAIEVGNNSDVTLTTNRIDASGIGLRIKGAANVSAMGNTFTYNTIAVALVGGDSTNTAVNDSITGFVKNNIFDSNNHVIFYVPYIHSDYTNRGLPIVEKNVGADLPGPTISTTLGRHEPSNGWGVHHANNTPDIAPVSQVNLYSLSVASTVISQAGAGASLVLSKAGYDWATNGVRCGDLVLMRSWGDSLYADVLTVENVSESTPDSGTYDTVTFAANPRDYSTFEGTTTVTLVRLADFCLGNQLRFTASSPATVSQVYGWGDGNVRNLNAYAGDDVTYSAWGNGDYGYKYVSSTTTASALTGTDTLFAAVGDGVILEAYQPFSGVKFDLGTALAASGDPIVLGTKYWDGAAWTQIPGVVTTNFLSSTGVAKIYWNPPEGWCPTTDPNATDEQRGYRYKVMITLTAGTGITAAITSTITQMSWLRLRTDTWPVAPVTDMETLTVRCIDRVWREVLRTDNVINP